MDMVLKQAGSTVLTLPSNEIYAAMQTGALDAAMTSSTSLISSCPKKSAALTTGRGKTYWFSVRAAADFPIVFGSCPRRRT